MKKNIVIALLASFVMFLCVSFGVYVAFTYNNTPSTSNLIPETQRSNDLVGTQVAVMLTKAVPTAKNTTVPYFTITPKTTPVPYFTRTPIPTSTEEGKIKYILETGFCLLDAPTIAKTTDPKSDYHCSLMKRRPYEMPVGHYLEFKGDTLDGRVMIYCALFSESGNFIVSGIDTLGTGKVICKP
jgi:hypothetical protein